MGWENPDSFWRTQIDISNWSVGYNCFWAQTLPRWVLFYTRISQGCYPMLNQYRQLAISTMTWNFGKSLEIMSGGCQLILLTPMYHWYFMLLTQTNNSNTADINILKSDVVLIRNQLRSNKSMKGNILTVTYPAFVYLELHCLVYHYLKKKSKKPLGTR